MLYMGRTWAPVEEDIFQTYGAHTGRARLRSHSRKGAEADSDRTPCEGWVAGPRNRRDTATPLPG